MGIKQPRQESLVEKISQLEKTISELQEQLQAHKQTQAMLARTERIALVGSWEWDIDSDEVTWSDGLYRIFQLDPAEKPSRWAEHGEHTHPEDMDRLRQASLKARTDGIPYEMVIRTFRKDGEIRWCLARGFPEKGADGRVKRLFGSVQDITERREAEAERDEYDSLLNSTLSAVDSLLMVIDKDHRVLLSNWKDHEWVPESQRRDKPCCYQVMKNREAPCRQCPAEQTFLDGRQRRYEEVNPIDGRHKEISLRPIFNHKGQVVYVLKNIRDVTQQKAAEEALRMQALTLNQIQDRITVTDLEGNITYVNDAECAMLGKSREELIGEKVVVYGEDSRE
ncbi:MAG: PAS domain S-box protein [Desulfosudaceae bacterium]